MQSPIINLDIAPFLLAQDIDLNFGKDNVPLIDAEEAKQLRKRLQKSNHLDTFSDCKQFTLAIRDRFFPHYFHFMETFLVLYAAHQEFLPNADLSQILFGNFVWCRESQAMVQKKMFDLIYPNSEIIDKVYETPIHVNTLLYLDRKLGRTSFNKMIDPVLFMVGKWAPKLRQAVYQAFGIKSEGAPAPRGWSLSRPKILYVPRHPPRTIVPELEPLLFEILCEFGDLERIDFAGLSWRDQVQVTAAHDIMIGVHGNGLTNLLWLPPHAMAIELFPEHTHHYDYQMMAEAIGIDYFGIEGFNIYRPYSRHGGPHSTRYVSVDRIMIDEIKFALSSYKLRQTRQSMSGLL